MCSLDVLAAAHGYSSPVSAKSGQVVDAVELIGMLESNANFDLPILRSAAVRHKLNISPAPVFASGPTPVHKHEDDASCGDSDSDDFDMDGLAISLVICCLHLFA